MSAVSSTRYRCTSCGNLTRFDVVTTRRTAAYHHFSVAGDLSVEDEQVLDEAIESVTCRWCGPAGAVQILDADEADEIADSRVIPDELIRGALEAALVVAIKDPLGAPKPLQPFLKFQKMPARAMPVVRKVLDTDEVFRTRVASVVALDLLDPPAVLFLTRPDAWETDLERLAAEEDKAETDEREAKAEKSAATQAPRRGGRAHQGRGPCEGARCRARPGASSGRTGAGRPAKGRDHRAQRDVGCRQPAQAGARARGRGGHLGEGARRAHPQRAGTRRRCSSRAGSSAGPERPRRRAARRPSVARGQRPRARARGWRPYPTCRVRMA